jgi:acetyl esterase/lipase
MGKRFRRLSTVGALLTLNGLRPLGNTNPLAIPSFFASWGTAELAPQNLMITTATSGALLAAKRGRLSRDDKLALGLNAFSAAGLAKLTIDGLQVKKIVENALKEGLGSDYLAHVDPAPTKADLTTPWRQVLRPWILTHPDVRRIRDIVYTGDPNGGRRHKLDIVMPREQATAQETAKRPVLLQIHGGAWITGSKNDQGIPLMNHLAARGWVCVAINYPLSPKATWPEHLIACKKAMKWIRENIAEYGGDPEFVCVTGGSAGGHLASMVALTAEDPQYQPGFEDVDTSVAACVSFYGAYDLANILNTKSGEREYKHFLRPTVFKTKDREVARSASPLTRVRPDSPPFFIIHGSRDSLVSVTEARELNRLLQEQSKNYVVYAELPGGQHAFDVFASVRGAHVIRGVERFLKAVQWEAAQAAIEGASSSLA